MWRSIEKYFEPTLIVIALTAILVLVFADVVARFAFSTSIVVANELARLCFVYMIYFGISYAIREHRHMRVTLLVDSLPQWLQRPVMALAEAVFLTYSIAVCYLGIEITQQAVERGKTLSATQWSTAVLYAAIIFSGLLCTLRLSYSLYRIVVHGESCFAPKGGQEE
ncbi:putative TRAP transporter small permease protein [Vibrio nigripulchritudo]|uniref:TRAP transporter small permease n=1 Tax=Vibrio nigripulchritudo TaxID=28173 RepID=UPI00190DD8D6|nr:TRAP transporter small permease [Vibrio nigripulchritudo]BCL70779.1 putative TRAP transporter small permease protein [Vibrio nigripulchritudo]BDU32135.1 putative TRAP transporter small permease protein [Vibrio nigripulchritudo]